MYIFSFIVGNIIPKSVKCIYSAAKSHEFRCGAGYNANAHFGEDKPSMISVRAGGFCRVLKVYGTCSRFGV